MKKTFAVFSAFVFILLSAVFPLSLSGCDNPTSSSAKTPLIETIPIIYITTSDLSPIPDNKNTVDCLVTLENGGEGYFETDLTATVRARGNGSLEVGKKHGKIPYKLKFEKKINLFGVGTAPSKDWVLIANMGDYTMLRNYTAKRLGAMLEGIPYSTASIPISLYVNNQYAGVYELTEQVEASPHRVPVDDNLTGTENGFLVELDRYAVSAEAGDLTFSVGQNYYTVKSKVANNDQFEYIKRKISDVDAAIYSGERDRIEKLVDMDSLIDMYLLQEFSKNIDAGFSSFYMYMNPGEKLVFAPPWDFDLAFGNDYRLDDGSAEEIYIGTGRKDFVQNHKWYIALYKNDWFKAEAGSRWQKLSSSHIPALIEEVSAISKVLAPDMETNFTRWPRAEGTRYQLEPNHILALSSYEEYVAHLIEWMETRKRFLDEEFA